MKGRDKKGRLKKGYKLTPTGVAGVTRVRRRPDGWRMFLLGPFKA